MTYYSIDILLLQNPLEGGNGQFSSKINDVDVVFVNGKTICYFEFTNNDAEIIANPYTKVKIGSNITESVYNLTTFIEDRGYTPVGVSNFNEVRDDEGIWRARVSYYTNTPVYFSYGSDGVSISIIGSSAPPVVITTKLKYFMQYKNVVGDEFKLDIFQKNYTGSSSEINGRVFLEKNEVKNHLEPIRGQGLNIELQASTETPFNDLFEINEMDYPVKFYRNNAILFDGYLTPEGVFQSFASDAWTINLAAVDGLGFLNDLSFVQTTGYAFNGKMSLLDIIYNCLNRSGIKMNICTYVPLAYNGMVDSNDVMTEVNIDVARFVRTDDNTLMSCLEVLKSALTITKSCITQQYGRWFIYRPSDFYSNEYPLAIEYNTNNSLIGNINFLNRITIGSHVSGIAPYHCNSNQMIEIKGSISAFRLAYKYGFIGSILGNGNLNHDAGTTIYDNWTFTPWIESKKLGFLSIDPLSTSGISFISQAPDIFDTVDNVVPMVSGNSDELLTDYTIDLKVRFVSYGYPVSMLVKVVLDATDGSGLWEMLSDGSWIFGNGGARIRNADNFPNTTGENTDEVFDRTITISSKPLPVNGTVHVFFTVPLKEKKSSYSGVKVDVKSVEVINTFAGNNVVGEFHTVSRINRVSSSVKETQTVNSGDNDSVVYEGALYMADKETLTKNWYRKGYFNQEQKPILRIAAEDELRIAQKPNKIFTGDVFGFIYYLSIVRINNVSGKFMPVGWSFDTFNNITRAKFLELYVPEISDIDYVKTLDYGETVKPTIIG